ncbi:MAG: PEP-CTERM sorting domain-containing protein, partial [gamma proteobacterium symbiont of Bathyaustriella thionipta]|nr:PEP-CTERM sorting domain-containing protein [gamma proteobacterium symbiont of Bathyaustriella thionipta]MCU7950262.1 PEP-CTERM sorting domain-containing protein [gamma proteobacterium symbiont of Bathyaustriella thionipta]MCU7954687.1 PEP-CTERM sorting domain-containing protein [gamma proteobacterium symbiont of Bathyaustriella thionipta]
DLAGGGFYSAALDVGADGSEVVGLSSSADGDEAFLRTQAGGMVGLGDLAGGGFYSAALDVGADGS